MTELSPIDIACIERDAAWFWIDATLECRRRGIDLDETYVQERLQFLREADPVEIKPLGFTPEQWDRETATRYPYIERAAIELLEKLRR